jgi:probable phosphoglycerate mutase
MPFRLIFTRHGESEANVAQVISNRDLPHPLTAKGKAQALTLADQLAARRIAALYASPILRAQQTAQILASQLGLTVQTADALREFDCGEMEGRGDEAAWQAHHAVVHAWDEEQDFNRCIPGGESFADLEARFVPFVQDVNNKYAELDGAVVLISHGSMLHQMLPLVLTNIDRAFTTQHPLGNCVCVIARLEAGQLICERWNGLSLGVD